MKLVQTIHTGYGLFIFALLFLLLFPLLLVPILFPAAFQMVGILNRWWAKLLLILSFIPYKVETRGKLDPRKQYIFCPNHFSYLDIPTMGLNPHNAIFVGKTEMQGIPLFGFMYRKLHITVDRSKLKSRFHTLVRSLEALDQGKSLVIYPEGGIVSSNPPHMAPFKDGAFRAAIEKQIAIVPVTIPFNWILLPDQRSLVRRGLIKVIFHEPVGVGDYDLDSVDRLKDHVYRVIDAELMRQNAPAHEPVGNLKLGVADENR